MIQKVEREDKAENRDKDGNYHPNFEAMLSAVFLAIGIGNRTATWPTWESIHRDRHIKFITLLNQFIPKSHPKLVVVEFQHKELSGNINPKCIITRDDNLTLLVDQEPQLTDVDLGIMFGFYRPNVYNYPKDLPGQSYAFQVLVSSLNTVSPLNTLLFAETFFPDHLSYSRIQKFSKYCEERINLYNKIMETLGWPYRFHGVFEATRKPGSILTTDMSALTWLWWYIVTRY